VVPQFYMPPLPPQTPEGYTKYPKGQDAYGGWPKGRLPDYPGHYAGLGREMRR
jgi:hypothetical protein